MFGARVILVVIKFLMMSLDDGEFPATKESFIPMVIKLRSRIIESFFKEMAST